MAKPEQIACLCVYGVLFHHVMSIDGLWETVKSQKTGETRKRVTLAALGLDEAGNKKLLGFHSAFEEDEASWTRFFDALQKRGVDFSKSVLAVTDGGAGRLSALERVAPEIPAQSCLTRRYRNVLKYTPHRLKTEMGKDLQRLTQTTSKDEFVSHLADMQKRRQTTTPQAIKSLLWNIQTAFTYFSFPKELWSTLRTTNPLERAIREIRARTRVHYDHYKSPQSSNKYHQAIFGNLNQHYFHATPSKVIHNEG